MQTFEIILVILVSGFIFLFLYGMLYTIISSIIISNRMSIFNNRKYRAEDREYIIIEEKEVYDGKINTFFKLKRKIKFKPSVCYFVYVYDNYYIQKIWESKDDLEKFIKKDKEEVEKYKNIHKLENSYSDEDLKTKVYTYNEDVIKNSDNKNPIKNLKV